jgi:hypothetical protein
MISTRSLEVPVPRTPIYSENANIFDPANSSPPNDFMIKLKMRSDLYSHSKDGLFSEYRKYSEKKSERMSQETVRAYLFHPSTSPFVSFRKKSLLSSLELKKADNLDNA